jgi:hypothetical protein
MGSGRWRKVRYHRAGGWLVEAMDVIRGPMHASASIESSEEGGIWKRNLRVDVDELHRVLVASVRPGPQPGPGRKFTCDGMPQVSL